MYLKHQGRKSRLLYLTIAAVFVLVSCGQRRDSESNAPSKIREEAFRPNPVKLEKQNVSTLDIGSQAPDFSLPDIHGKFYTLDDFRNSRVLVVVFTCNHCPTAQAYEERLIRFTSDYSGKSVATIAIMPNSTYALLLEECGYSDLNDSYYEMKLRAEDKNFNFPYLYDGDTQSTAIKYGPVATPHVFVFDEERKLRYRGRIDGSEKPGTGNAEDLRAAVDSVLNGVRPGKEVNKAFGCSVKWSWKSDWAEQVNRKWEEQAVEVESLYLDDIDELLSNKTGKLLLVNFWATWCAPCVTEYPELVKIQRMYGNRDFEFVSISTDTPENRDKVMAFLEQENSSLRNYHYMEKDKYDLIERVDSAWGGALPYSMLIEPGGEVIFREQGIVNILHLRKHIVEHPLLGRFY